MSWFDDHASELEAAGVSQEQARDFEARNPGDFGRIIEANTNVTDSGGGDANIDEGNDGGGGDDGPSYEDWLASHPAPQSIQPFTDQFSYADFVATQQRAPGYEQFRPTAVTDLEADPSWKLRLSEAQKALERSAAASGSYLTPNTMQAITRNSQDYASNEFGNVDTRRFRNWGTGYNRLRDEDADIFSRDLTTYGTNRGNQSDVFDRRRSIFETNEQNRFNSQRSNRMDDFGIVTGDRNFGLASQNMDLMNRQFDLSKANQAFNQNRSSYLDDFNMWTDRDDERARRGEFMADIGTRQ